MNRKITLLALGGKCGFFGARGLASLGPALAAAAGPAKKPSRDSRPVMARPVKPAPASQRHSRRGREQKDPAGLAGAVEAFIMVNLDQSRYTNSFRFNTIRQKPRRATSAEA